MPFRTPLEAAIAHLIAKGKIKSNSDVMRDLELKSRGTISAYASGTAKMSKGFRTLFENYYKINLDDFNHLVESNSTELTLLANKNPNNNQDFLQKYVEQLEKNNEILGRNLEQMEVRLKAVDKAFEQIEIIKSFMNRFEKNQKEIVANLGEIAENQFLFGAVQQGWQEYWSEHLKGAPATPLHEVKEMIRIKVISLLQTYSDKGKEAVLMQGN